MVWLMFMTVVPALANCAHDPTRVPVLGTMLTVPSAPLTKPEDQPVGRLPDMPPENVPRASRLIVDRSSFVSGSPCAGRLPRSVAAFWAMTKAPAGDGCTPSLLRPAA